MVKPTGIYNFIDRIRKENTGPGKRFHNDAHFEAVRRQVANAYDEEDILNLPTLCEDGMTGRQAALLISTLGLDKAQTEHFMQALRAYRKLHTDYKKSFSPEEIQQRIDAIVSESATSPATVEEAAPVAPALPEPPAAVPTVASKSEATPAAAPIQAMPVSPAASEPDAPPAGAELQTPEKKPSALYIATRLSDAFTQGRFKSMEKFFEILEQVSTQHGETITDFMAPINDRQVKIISAVLGFSYGECMTLALMVLDELKDPQAQAQFSKYYDFNYAVISKQLNTALKCHGDFVLQRTIAPHLKSAEPNDEMDPDDDDEVPVKKQPKQKKQVSAPPLAAKASPVMADDIAAHPDETSAPIKAKKRGALQLSERTPTPVKPVELRFPGGKTGVMLLAHAREQKWSGSDLLLEIYRLSGEPPPNFFANALGISKHRYSTLILDPSKNIGMDALNAVAEHMGATTDMEKTEWRKFFFAIDPAINQAVLNQCFDPDTSYTLDAEVTGEAHKLVLSRFLKLLANTHGFRNRRPLAYNIAAHTGIDETLLHTSILSLAISSHFEILSDPHNTPTQVLSEELSRAIAEYAFPGDPERQKKCMSLFSDPKYRMSTDERATRMWESRHTLNKEALDSFPTKEDRSASFPFPTDMQDKELKGQALLDYALAKHAANSSFTFSALLEEMLLASGLKRTTFAREFGMQAAQYDKFVRGDSAAPTLSTLNRFADGLGARNEQERIEWRKFIIGADPSVTQELLNTCLKPEAKTIKDVDTEAQGFGRTIALCRFFKLLAHSRGLADRGQLKDAIALHANLPEEDKGRLHRTINNLTGNIEFADIDTAQLSAEELNRHDMRSKIFASEVQPLAEAVINYAFPGDSEDAMARRKACMEFLTSAEKYHVPDEVISKHRSTAMHNVRQEKFWSGSPKNKRGSADQLTR